MKKNRAVCPGCGREMAVDIPADGSGAADVFPRHTESGGRYWQPRGNGYSYPAADACGWSRGIVPNDAYV